MTKTKVKPPQQLREEDEMGIRFLENEFGETIVEEIEMEPIEDNHEPEPIQSSNIKQSHPHKIILIKPQKYIVCVSESDILKNGVYIEWQPEFNDKKLFDIIELRE